MSKMTAEELLETKESEIKFLTGTVSRLQARIKELEYTTPSANDTPEGKREQLKLWEKAAIHLFETHNPDVDQTSLMGQRLLNGFRADMWTLSVYYNIKNKERDRGNGCDDLHNEYAANPLLDEVVRLRREVEELKAGIKKVVDGPFTMNPQDRIILRELLNK